MVQRKSGRGWHLRTEAADASAAHRVEVAHVMRVLAAVLALTTVGCSTVTRPPLRTVPFVNLERFMGDWYVIASIPTFLEKGAHDAVESYRLGSDGVVETTFTFRKGSFDGAPKRLTAKGFVVDTRSNAVWGMRFVWPIKAEYLITYVAEDYSVTVIGRNKRDYVWLMARTPRIPEAEYERLIAMIGEQGYDVSQVQRVPQSLDDVTPNTRPDTRP